MRDTTERPKGKVGTLKRWNKRRTIYNAFKQLLKEKENEKMSKEVIHMAMD